MVDTHAHLGSGGLVVEPDRLNAAQKASLYQYRVLSSARGVSLGAVLGPSAWDVRPVHLEGGGTTIVRFTNPSLGADPVRYAEMQRLVSLIRPLAPQFGILAIGESDGQAWIKRPYYQGTLAEARGEIPGVQPITLMRALVRLIRILHESGAYHGHLCLANLTIQQGSPYILDPLFRALLPTDERSRASISSLGDVAPELLAGVSVTRSIDVYGLGTIARRFVSPQVGQQMQGFIAMMLQADPLARPSMEEVQGFFDGQFSFDTSRRATGGFGAEPMRIPGIQQHPQYSPEPVNPYAQPPPPQMPPGMQPQYPQGEHYQTSGYSPQQPHGQNPPQGWAPQAPSPQPSSGINYLIPLFLLTLLLLLVRTYHPELIERFWPFGQSAGSIPYHEYWRSGVYERIREVALAATIRNDAVAQQMILSSIRKGESAPDVGSALLKIALDPRWAAQLTDEDREVAFTLALIEYLPERKKQRANWEIVHPGVVLAVLGAIQDGEGLFKSLPPSRLGSLPPPFGVAFAKLQALGVESLADPTAPALASFLLGDRKPVVLEKFFGSEDSDVLSLQKLLLLFPDIEKDDRASQDVYSLFLEKPGRVGEVFRWYEQSTIASWKDVKPSVRLGIALGKLGAGLTQFQLADLLMFELPQVREIAVERLVKGFASQLKEAVAFFASPENMLTRDQTIELLMALRGNGDDQRLILEKIFKAGPDPKTILGLLLVRAQALEESGFDGMAARYLTEKNFKPPRAQLLLLASHPVPKVRGFAYQHLDAAIPEDRKLLEEFYQLESDADWKRRLGVRLKMATDINTDPIPEATAVPEPAVEQPASREAPPAKKPKAKKPAGR